ncbi:MAG: hypothetical protein A2Z27_04670 [candidate division Zixibacteria bacterium RBG_16_50_21]|nr:MAG: hypothetical protein A2Z27_04670 [candidate division Zixibacteria bacterium RBG_16_50_21]
MARGGEFGEKRIRYFWDEDVRSGKMWQGVLGLSQPAWDVYMLHGLDAKWGRKPDLWMHQLGEVNLERASFLDANKLELEVRKLLESSSE